ncbi:uncharacterized protein LOC124172846 isoform X2 [Ischnura elegans]|uniref:uncharacterized protein LOC124172846 isoform X2 n=1 Tax=Ischnura elegans TaxID=197161 RepID=UPI001ED87B1F|nr:uncharacterized protein LOC124172846 isoform X2 [Ischnura elegans]
MASNVSANNAEVLVEERLLNALFTGSMLEHRELLDMLEDVDVRGMRQKTLLHVAVRIGKVEWVEELLERGADPNLTDENQVNALSAAVEMARQFPEDSDRLQVLKLVTSAHRRDQAMIRRLESSSSGTAEQGTPVGRPHCNNASLRFGEEMKCMVRQLSSSIEELKGQMCGRDTLLRCLEDAVTSIAEEVTSIKSRLAQEDAVRLPPSGPAQTREECVDALLHRTQIVYGRGLELMRRLYERLYDEDECTACILKYLSGDDRVNVLVDCESMFVGRIKGWFEDLDGSECDGSGRCSFCDLETDTVYLGAKVSSDYSENKVATRLIRCLSQLALKFAFCNGGRPHEPCSERELEWLRALRKIEEEQEKGGNLHFWFSVALGKGTIGAKVCLLATAVPAIIACDGSAEGRAVLQEQAPLLFSLYCRHVLPTLLA